MAHWANEEMLLIFSPWRATTSRRETMSAASAARSFLRSAVPKATAASARASATGPKSKPSPSPFRVPAQKPTSQRILRQRYPVELSSSMESILPYHSATASALLISMLSVSPRSCGWTLEGLIDDA